MNVEGMKTGAWEEDGLQNEKVRCGGMGNQWGKYEKGETGEKGVSE